MLSDTAFFFLFPLLLRSGLSDYADPKSAIGISKSSDLLQKAGLEACAKMRDFAGAGVF